MSFWKRSRIKVQGEANLRVLTSCASRPNRPTSGGVGVLKTLLG